MNDPAGLRRLLIRFKDGQSPTLTEEAWDHFFALEDLDELSWLVALASLNVVTSPLCDVRRALFENRPLRAWAMAAGRDAARMERVGEEIRRETVPDAPKARARSPSHRRKRK